MLNVFDFCCADVGDRNKYAAVSYPTPPPAHLHPARVSYPRHTVAASNEVAQCLQLCKQSLTQLQQQFDGLQHLVNQLVHSDTGESSSMTAGIAFGRTRLDCSSYQSPSAGRLLQLKPKLKLGLVVSVFSDNKLPNAEPIWAIIRLITYYLYYTMLGPLGFCVSKRIMGSMTQVLRRAGSS